MKKLLTAFACTLLGGSMIFAAACGGGNSGGGSDLAETRALSLSIGALDGNFNPFFYTSLTDGQVISMTQSSLITSDVDQNGDVQPAAGDNYNTVAKDFEIKYYNAPSGGTECSDTVAAQSGRTEYRFPSP